MTIIDDIPWANGRVTLAVLVLAAFLAYRIVAPAGLSLPEPKGSLPIIGATLGFMHYARRQQLQRYLAEQTRALGPIWNFKVLGSSTPIVSDAREVRRVLTDTETFRRGPAFADACKGFCDYALFMIESTMWKHHRKLVQPSFGPAGVRRAVAVTVKQTDKLLSIWEGRMKDDPNAEVNLHDSFQRLALDVVGDLMLGGHQFKSLDTMPLAHESVTHVAHKRTDASSGDMFESFERMVQAVGDRVGSPEWTWRFFSATVKDMAPDATFQSHLAHSVIAKRQAELDAMTELPTKDELDVLDRLLIPTADGEKLPLKEIVDEVWGFILAGHETSSSAATFAMHFLMTYPDVCSKLTREISTVLGDREPTFEDLTELRYLDQFFKESLRLNSSVNVLNRVTTKATTISGYTIPANQNCLVNLRAIHRDPKYWGPTADDFNPDRWADKEAMRAIESVGAYMPFGGGGKICVGKKVAEAEVKQDSDRESSRAFTHVQPLRPQLDDAAGVETQSIVM
ncbi:hypothetical protein HKX48_006123 [Thoreauomyces humboldtii]|nr:hypothetical protein HKX48_006123 [Thoreauomyces humboldtii]